MLAQPSGAFRGGQGAWLRRRARARRSPCVAVRRARACALAGSLPRSLARSPARSVPLTRVSSLHSISELGDSHGPRREALGLGLTALRLRRRGEGTPRPPAL